MPVLVFLSLPTLCPQRYYNAQIIYFTFISKDIKIDLSLDSRRDIKRAALDISSHSNKAAYAEATKFLLQAIINQPAVVTEYLSILAASDGQIHAPMIRRALRKMAENTGQDGLINIWSESFVPTEIDEY